ncbi:auxin-responsive protein IAA18-like isoform X1 [Oryza brachyantha]|uniref:Auxin-responsive protein n=1 Tax=Oryza brachyantha TaxID=4533 RepID=J3M910_ORYBR|nr:auxin-responsive protein IAA18-like isoform X1 [Oryza brachyantha]XP_006654668.1 auxin-responsive protein IAA18-like isoform X1 [Oryza brachyantha]XP_015693262.1 auxin-responsive protein IAA18-like isoform X1 [Oryza brachyantha]
MEEEFKDKGLPPTLLNLIPDGREWKVKEAGGERSRNTSVDAHEDEELELKLGLPGLHEGEQAAGSREKIQQQQQDGSSAPSPSCFPAHSKAIASITTTGAKRGSLASVGATPEGYNQIHRDREECGNELTLGGENMAGERKKGCSPSPPSHGSAAVHSSNPQGRGAIPPVVGWPPIRSFRRNLTTNGSSSKQSPEQQNDEADDKAKLICKKRPLVKINMDGIPIGRKVDLALYDSYQKLSSAVEELFRGFLEAQKDLSCAESGEQGTEEKIFSGLLDGTGEYTLVYEDNDGDRMLAGDIPWNVFVSTAKRLRVMRRSELPHDMQKLPNVEAI